MFHNTRLHNIALILTFIAMIGAFWYYIIDGTYVNPVIEYRDVVDLQELLVDKPVYFVGDTPRYLVSYCKRREAEVVLTWVLTNKNGRESGLWTPIDGQEPRNGAIGCEPPDGIGRVEFPMKPIPEDTEVGCGYRFIAIGVRTFSGGRTQSVDFRTESFCITK